MAPKRTTKSSPATTTTTTTLVTDAQLKVLIDQGVARALAARDADRSRNDEDSHDSGMGVRRQTPPAQTVFCISNWSVENQIKFSTCTLLGSALTWWNSHVMTIGLDVAYAMTWELALLCVRMFPKESKKIERYIGGLPYMIHESVVASKPKTMQEAIEMQQPLKKQGVAIAYTAGPGERKEYAGTLPLCNKCKFHHNGQCIVKCVNCKRVGHLTQDCRSPPTTNNHRNPTCYECGNQGHYKSDCPK
nr:hypothetical protein [Tanacetum cinerariifolium]